MQQAIGMPYIVFAGNVGGDQALAQVVAILNGNSRTPDPRGATARQRVSPSRHVAAVADPRSIAAQDCRLIAKRSGQPGRSPITRPNG
jgi:hypothetical protein